MATTYFDITRSTEPNWRSTGATISTSSSGVFTQAMMEQYAELIMKSVKERNGLYEMYRGKQFIEIDPDLVLDAGL